LLSSSKIQQAVTKDSRSSHAGETKKTVLLFFIYNKSDKDSISGKEIKELLNAYLQNANFSAQALEPIDIISGPVFSLLLI